MKTAYTAYALDINTPVLLFDWPGNQGEGRGGYLQSREAAAKSAPDLGRVAARRPRNRSGKYLADGQQPLAARRSAMRFPGWRLTRMCTRTR